MKTAIGACGNKPEPEPRIALPDFSELLEIYKPSDILQGLKEALELKISQLQNPYNIRHWQIVHNSLATAVLSLRKLGG